MTSPKHIQKDDVVSVKVAGAVFILPVYGFFEGNRAIVYLLTPSGFLISVAVHQLVAIHGTDRNIIHLFEREKPPICLKSSQYA